MRLPAELPLQPPAAEDEVEQLGASSAVPPPLVSPACAPAETGAAADITAVEGASDELPLTSRVQQPEEAESAVDGAESAAEPPGIPPSVPAEELQLLSPNTVDTMSLHCGALAIPSRSTTTVPKDLEEQMQAACQVVAALMGTLQLSPSELERPEQLQLMQIVLQTWGTQQAQRHATAVEQ